MIKKTALTVALIVILIMAGLVSYAKIQMRKVSDLSFEQALEYTTRDNPDAVITVGIIKDGRMSYKVYGENGRELPDELHTYEIGSLTKTFTAALVNRAILEGKINIDESIEKYLLLPAGNGYPTIRELLTHTSGYKGYYFENPMIENHLKGRNDFYGISKDAVYIKMSKLSMGNDRYDYRYSNFGYAVLGLLLEEVYGEDYTALLNEFAADELGLSDTHVSDQNGDLGNCWEWNEDDAYISAGAVTSNIADMLNYAQLQLDNDPDFDNCHKSLRKIDASTKAYEAMDIRMDEIGMAWIIDEENGIIWHNGGTGDYNCYLGFEPGEGKAVVILSNLSPDYRIPATVMGVKLLKEL